MLHERFTSLEQQASRRVRSIELTQATWQAKREVAPPPYPARGSSYATLEYRVCELDSRVTEVEDDLWQPHATVGGFVPLSRSPGEPTASAAQVVGLGAPVNRRAPVRAEVPSASPTTMAEAGTCRGVHAAWYAREIRQRFPCTGMRTLRGSPCPNPQLRRTWA